MKKEREKGIYMHAEVCARIVYHYEQEEDHHQTSKRKSQSHQKPNAQDDEQYSDHQAENEIMAKRKSLTVLPASTAPPTAPLQKFTTARSRISSAASSRSGSSSSTSISGSYSITRPTPPSTPPSCKSKSSQPQKKTKSNDNSSCSRQEEEGRLLDECISQEDRHHFAGIYSSSQFSNPEVAQCYIRKLLAPCRDEEGEGCDEKSISCAQNKKRSLWFYGHRGSGKSTLFEATVKLFCQELCLLYPSAADGPTNPRQQMYQKRFSSTQQNQEARDGRSRMVFEDEEEGKEGGNDFEVAALCLMYQHQYVHNSIQKTREKNSENFINSMSSSSSSSSSLTQQQFPPSSSSYFPPTTRANTAIRRKEVDAKQAKLEKSKPQVNEVLYSLLHQRGEGEGIRKGKGKQPALPKHPSSVVNDNEEDLRCSDENKHNKQEGLGKVIQLELETGADPSSGGTIPTGQFKLPEESFVKVTDVSQLADILSPLWATATTEPGGNQNLRGHRFVILRSATKLKGSVCFVDLLGFNREGPAASFFSPSYNHNDGSAVTSSSQKVNSAGGRGEVVVRISSSVQRAINMSLSTLERVIVEVMNSSYHCSPSSSSSGQKEAADGMITSDILRQSPSSGHHNNFFSGSNLRSHIPFYTSLLTKLVQPWLTPSSPCPSDQPQQWNNRKRETLKGSSGGTNEKDGRQQSLFDVDLEEGQQGPPRHQEAQCVASETYFLLCFNGGDKELKIEAQSTVSFGLRAFFRSRRPTSTNPQSSTLPCLPSQKLHGQRQQAAIFLQRWFRTCMVFNHLFPLVRSRQQQLQQWEAKEWSALLQKQKEELAILKMEKERRSISRVKKKPTVNSSSTRSTGCQTTGHEEGERKKTFCEVAVEVHAVEFCKNKMIQCQLPSQDYLEVVKERDALKGEVARLEACLEGSQWQYILEKNLLQRKQILAMEKEIAELRGN